MNTLALNDLLKKYESFKSLDLYILSQSCLIIKEETGFIIDSNLIAINKNTLYLQCIPLLKKEILIKKDSILKKINNTIPKENTIQAIF